MKTFIKILPLLALLVAFSSCKKDNISDKVAGEYYFGDKSELVINEIPANPTDYPDASVKIESMGDNLISLKLKNILLSNKECTLTGEVTSGTKASEGYYFSTVSEEAGMTVNATGYVNGDNISINVSFELKYNLIGKWSIGLKTPDPGVAQYIVPDVYFKFDADIETIVIGGEEYKIADLVSFANTLLWQYAGLSPVSSIEFAKDGHFNLYSDNPGMMDTLNMHVNNRLEFYSDATYIYFNIKKSIIDELNQEISDYGITIPSPLSVMISYKLDGSNLNLELNKSNTALYLIALNSIIADITYQKIIAIYPELPFSEEEFEAYKAIAVQAMSLLMDSGTTYALGANLIPAK